MNDEARDTVKQARQLQEKFELYMVALVFTVLGLAVQTAKFDSGLIASGFELAGWLALLLSGIVAFLRLELVPNAYGLLANKQAQERDAAAVTKAVSESKIVVSQETGCSIDPAALVQRKARAANALEASFARLQRSMMKRYRLHKWSFVAGITSLICSRGYSAAVDLATAIVAHFGK